MDDNYGDLEIDENRLKAADPDGLYLFMLLGGTKPEAGTPSMGTAIETVR